MASWKWPALVNNILSDVPGVNVLLNALLKQDPAGTTDIPAGAKRWTDGADGKQFQTFNGSTWESVGKLDHDVASVDGYSASTGTTANTIPVRGSDGKIPGDISGNAATASKAAALSATNPIELGGTGATTAEQARANLVTPPKSHASGSDEFGAGSNTLYGHLKSHDAPDAALTAAGGHAFSPAGAAAMAGEIIDIGWRIDNLAGVVSGNAASQSARDAEQDSAIASAGERVSNLDTTLRALIAQELAKYLKLSGGTLTGDLTFPSGHISYNIDAKARGFVLKGNNAPWNSTAGILLNASDSPDNPGKVYLHAANGTAVYEAEFSPDGRASWKGNEFAFFPDWSAAVQLSVNETYVVDRDSYFYCMASDYNGNTNTSAISSLWINGVEYRFSGAGGTHPTVIGTCIFPVSKGSTVHMTCSRYGYGEALIWIPAKGAVA